MFSIVTVCVRGGVPGSPFANVAVATNSDPSRGTKRSIRSTGRRFAQRLFELFCMLEMRDESRSRFFEQRLQLGVFCARDQRLVDGIEHRLVVRHFLRDVGFVERIAVELLQRSDVVFTAL